MRIGAFFVAWSLASAGCAASRNAALDASLPDGVALQVETPFDALSAFASHSDPDVRGPALVAIVDTSSVDALGRWAMQGTYDPDPWVQRPVVDALLSRVAEPEVHKVVVDYALRGSGDPYVRAHVAHSLLDRGMIDGLQGMRTAWQGRPTWRAAPLALVAMRMGEEAALLPLTVALSQAEVRDDLSFMVDLGQYGSTALLSPIEQGVSWAEEALIERYDVTRALLGDAGGRAAWRNRVTSDDPTVARDALDLALVLPEEARRAWLRDAKKARDPAVRAVASLVLKPTLSALRKAHGSRDAYARLAAMRWARLVGDDGASVLAAGMLDQDDDVRAAAAMGAGRMGGAQWVGALRTLAVDDRAEVRVAAYAALLRIEGSQE